MPTLILQSEDTENHRKMFFEAVDATDGFTAEPGLTFGAGDLKVCKRGGSEANAAGTVAEKAAGIYEYTFTQAELDTLGEGYLRTAKSGVANRAVKFQVVSFDPYNSISLGLGNLNAATGDLLLAASYENVDDFLDKSDGIETGWTPRQTIRAMASVLLGLLEGGGSGRETFRSLDNSRDAVIMTVDSTGTGNRTARTTDV